jgi:hypothetical protein
MIEPGGGHLNKPFTFYVRYRSSCTSLNLKNIQPQTKDALPGACVGPTITLVIDGRRETAKEITSHMRRATGISTNTLSLDWAI